MKKVFAIVLAIMLVPAVVYCLPDFVSTDVELSPSGTFVDVGTEITVKGAQDVGLYITTEGKVSTSIQFRVLTKTDSAGTSEYFFPDMQPGADLTVTSTDYTFGITNNLTGSYCLNIPTNGIVKYIQVQGSSKLDDSTAAATGATVTSLKVVQNT